MKKGTLLILAYECYPYNRTGSAIGAQRPYHFAQDLSTMGWKTIVICCDASQRRTIKREDVKKTSQHIIESFSNQLLESDCVIIPTPSLQYNGFADYIWSKSIQKGVGDTYVPKGFPYNVVRKISTFYNQLFKGDYSCSWVPVAETISALLLKNIKVDVILGEHSPDGGIVLADKISRRQNIPWLADFRDPVLRQFKPVFKFFYKPIVKKIVESSSAIINVNPYWASLDESLFNKKAYTIFNGYDQNAFFKIPSFEFSQFTVSYFGSFNNKFQDIMPSLKSFSAFVKKDSRYSKSVIFYRGLYYQEFYSCCIKAGISKENINVENMVSREDVMSYMKGSSVLLIYSTPSYKSRNIYEDKGFLPGKVFEYIGSGTAILQIPSDNGLLESFINENNAGYSCANIDKAVSYLEQQFELAVGTTEIKKSAINKTYSRRSQSVVLDKLLSMQLK